MAMAAALLDTLCAPSIDGVCEVYLWLKSILGTATAQQAESPLQHWVEASVSNPICSKDGAQRATQGAPEAEMGSTSVRTLAYDRLSRPSTRSEPQVHRRHRPGADDV
jgi:hypothetical protein